MANGATVPRIPHAIRAAALAPAVRALETSGVYATTVALPGAMRNAAARLGAPTSAAAYATNISISIEMKGYSTMMQALSVLVPLAVNGLGRGAHDMAKDFAKTVKERYLKWGAPQDGTQKKRVFEGFPPVPLAQETGAMLESLTVRKHGPTLVRVFIAPEHAAKAVIFEEGRKEITIVPTRKSWFYLGLVLGFNGLSFPPPKIIVKIPDRPTWFPTVKYVVGQASRYLYPALRFYLRMVPGCRVVG